MNNIKESIENLIEKYTTCVGCKHDGGQNAYGSLCEECYRNPNYTDEYERTE